MTKLLSILLILAGLQMGSIAQDASAPVLAQRGCACHCAPDQVTFRVWQQKYGPPDRFAAQAIREWFNNKTEHLILLGQSAKGMWSLETQETDTEGAIYSNLVCTTIEGKRKVFSVIKGLEVTYEMKASFLGSLVLRRLGQLAKSGQWDVGSLIPVQLPPPSKPPALIFHEKGKPETEGYGWSLNVKARDGQMVRVERSAGCCNYFRGAKCFGGVRDDAQGEIWWILVKTAGSDNCAARWHSIRLIDKAPVKQ